jgi:hypothetical protein
MPVLFFSRHAALPTVLAMGLMACSAEAPASETPVPVPPPAAATVPAEATIDAALPADETPDTAATGVPDAVLAVPPPGPAAVLDAAYGPSSAAEEGAPAGERLLADGRGAAFWRGQVFALGGAGWYVGFAAAAVPSEFPAPDQTVELAQATWRFIDGTWEPVSAASGIGAFGGEGRAPSPDETQDARVVEAEGGRVLMALPVADLANAGVRLHAYELFAGEGEPLAWRHVGRLPAGSDNHAGCSTVVGAAVPCASTAGTLEFVAEGASWPTLRLALEGQVVEGPGQLRPTTSADVVTLAFNAASGRYEPVGAIPDAAY